MIGTPRECPAGLAAERFVKIALAAFFKSRTVVTNLWIARRLQIGDPSMGSRYCAEIGTMWGRSVNGLKKQEARTAPH